MLSTFICVYIQNYYSNWLKNNQNGNKSMFSSKLLAGGPLFRKLHGRKRLQLATLSDWKRNGSPLHEIITLNWSSRVLWTVICEEWRLKHHDFGMFTDVSSTHPWFIQEIMDEFEHINILGEVLFSCADEMTLGISARQQPQTYQRANTILVLNQDN